MKKIFKVLVFALFATSVFAQSPDKMSYQAVIRNSENRLVVNKQVGMQISILRGSANGSVVYTENHNPVTNANGLVSIVIGSGSTGDSFSAIDWSSNIYFIKTEIDPNGGNNYTITSVSQLLSVPYALHAKTADRVTGKITETDPKFTNWDKSTGINITKSQISDLGTIIEKETDPVFSSWSKDYNDLTNKPGNATNMNDGFMSMEDKQKLDKIKDFSGSYNDLTDKPTNATDKQDGFMSREDKQKLDNINGSETKIIAAPLGGIEVKGSGTTSDPYIIGKQQYEKHYVGEKYGGGIVFWVDRNGQHGLIVGEMLTGSHGYLNAEIECKSHKVTIDGQTYSDWRLPKRAELIALWRNCYEVRGIELYSYWTSTKSNYFVWVFNFDKGTFETSYTDNSHYVIPVRTF